MNIHRKNGFMVSEVNSPASIGIESDRVDQCIEHYHTGNFGGVFGHPSFGFRGVDLDFLKMCSSASRVWFWGCSFSNVDGLYELPELAYCGVMEKRPGIDFSRFKHLHTLVSHWNKKDAGFNQSAIKKFHLWHCNPRSKSFEEIAIPNSVEHLQLTWINPSTLEGLPVMESLTELQIHRGRNLSDIDRLHVIAPRLRKLIITTCGRLKGYEGLLSHPSLELAIIDGHRIKG